MSEVTLSVTPEQLDQLGAKLGELEAGLTEEERTILLAIFAVAAETLNERAAEEVEGFGFKAPNPGGPVMSIGRGNSLPGLQQGFNSAFSRVGPGGLAGGRGNPAAADGVEVTGSITVRF